MPTRIHITGFLFFSGLVFATALVFQGETPSWSWFAALSTVTTVMVLVTTLFNKVAWKWKVFRLYKWFVDRPIIDGTWKGTFSSNYKMEDGKLSPPKPCYLVIRQTYFSINIVFLTPESSSTALAASIIEEREVKHLFYVYQNTPQFRVRHQSALHFGGVCLKIHEHVEQDCIERLSGHYFSDRSTAGEISFEQHISSQHASDFKGARKLTAKLKEKNSTT